MASAIALSLLPSALDTAARTTQTCTVLHQDVPLIGEDGSHVVTLPMQPGIRIRRAGMGVIAARSPAFAIATAVDDFVEVIPAADRLPVQRIFRDFPSFPLSVHVGAVVLRQIQRRTP